MTDPFAAIPSGWRAITAEMDDRLGWVAPAARYTMVQVERGLLRVQVTPTNPEAERVLREAERRASITCELCGEPGSVWINAARQVSTLCGECRGD